MTYCKDINPVNKKATGFPMALLTLKKGFIIVV